MWYHYEERRNWSEKTYQMVELTLLITPSLCLPVLADAVSDSMGAGVLIELIFRKMSSTLSGGESIGVSEMSQAFQAGVDTICLYIIATMVLEPCWMSCCLQRVLLSSLTAR